MMKVLFITCSDLKNNFYGGGKCSYRNYTALSRFCNVQIYQIRKKSNYMSLKSLLTGYVPPVSNNDRDAINDLLKKTHIDLIFFDGSIFGQIGMSIKRKFENIKIITFFSNVEYDYVDVRFGKQKRKEIYRYVIQKSELYSIKSSNKIITLTERDKSRINQLYKRVSDAVIPFTMDDFFVKNDISKNNERKKCLIVASYNRPNIEGIEWFVKNVSPFINGDTQIIGKGFEVIKDQLESEKVEVIGFVENLWHYYRDADCVALPVLSGAGIKIKTLEALMYGKTIFGTNEAFVGYDLEFNKVGGLCNTSQLFVEKINDFFENSEGEKINEYSRKIFIQKYTLQISDWQFEQIINLIE